MPKYSYDINQNWGPVTIQNFKKIDPDAIIDPVKTKPPSPPPQPRPPPLTEPVIQRTPNEQVNDNRGGSVGKSEIKKPDRDPMYISKILLTERDRTFELMFAHYKFEALKEFTKHRFQPKEQEVIREMNNFKKIKTIGTGSFGQVLLVKEKETTNYYAIKIMKKAEMIKQKQVAHVLNEQKILRAVDFPFLIKLYCSFKDNDNIYLTLSYAPGGDVFNVLSHKRKLKEKFVKFYAAQLVLALDYLHSLNIVYRDLKPENLVIGKDGYLLITDFGLSKRVRERTYTIAGTPEYLAPEILLNRGYGTSVDWWTLGIVIFELTAGYTPFHRSNEDVMKMYERIIKEGKVTNYPINFSLLLQDLLDYLIQKDLSKRFGNLKYGATQIRAHPWFKDIDWYNIFRKREKPVFVPRLKDDEDTAYFQEYPEDESIFNIGSEEQFQKEFADF